MKKFLVKDRPTGSFISIKYKCENCGSEVVMAKLKIATQCHDKSCWCCHKTQPKYFEMLCSEENRITYHFTGQLPMPESII